VKGKEAGDNSQAAICFHLRQFSEWTEAESMLHRLFPYCSICIPPVPDCIGSVFCTTTFAAENSKT